MIVDKGSLAPKNDLTAASLTALRTEAGTDGRVGLACVFFFDMPPYVYHASSRPGQSLWLFDSARVTIALATSGCQASAWGAI